MWWCPICKIEVPVQEVTYYGYCGRCGTYLYNLYDLYNCQEQTTPLDKTIK